MCYHCMYTSNRHRAILALISSHVCVHRLNRSFQLWFGLCQLQKMLYLGLYMSQFIFQLVAFFSIQWALVYSFYH